LRIGDAVAAMDIWELNIPANESDESLSAMKSALSTLARHQGGAASLWGSPGPFAQLPDAREIVKAADHGPDLHRSGFLFLLSGEGELPTSGSIAGFSTIEDYLFGLLWEACRSPTPVVHLENVGKTIRQFGSSYFGDQDSGGWSYSLPLLASQQFRSALSFLVQAGGATGLLQATHTGMLLSDFGVTLENLGDSAHHASGSLVTSLLVDYSAMVHSIPSCGALCALEYLLWITNKSQMMNEVVALILRSNDINLLSGTLSSDGRRCKGKLDQFFSEREVNQLLKEAAEMRLKDPAIDRHKKAAAGVLFMLAGDFRSVVSLLSRLMAPDSNAPTNEEKLFWRTQTENFYSSYLAKRTHVYEVLEKNGDLDVVTTCRALMELSDFFACFSRGDVDAAFAILDRLDILPKSLSDISSKALSYSSLDPLLQQAIPSVLLRAMQLLFQEHNLLKRDMHSGDSGATIMSALQGFEERARVLVSFSGIVAVPQNIAELLNSLEATISTL